MTDSQLTMLLDQMQKLSADIQWIHAFLGFFCGTVFFLFVFYIVFCWRATK